MDKRTKIPRELLIAARKERLWLQQELASLLGTTQHNISRWEQGATTPSPYFSKRLCELFGKSPQELGLFNEKAATAEPQCADGSGDIGGDHSQTDHVPVNQPPSLWTVPYPRNPFFTGRDDVLQQLHEVLHREGTALLSQSCALSGLGGIGKTQVALEYVYRHASAYTAVFWITAETSEVLLASLVTLAEHLSLPERTEQNHQRVVHAVSRWLENQRGWLLVCDNVEDLALLQPILPATRQGSLLITTRLQALGTAAQQIVVTPMDLEEGTTFLLQRAKRLRPGLSCSHLARSDILAAQAIVETMDGLPLALDQAGAYIEETKCSLADYLQQYQQRRLHLLTRRGLSAQDHPTSIQTTLSLAFQQVQQRNPVAADVLCLCAYLAPEVIPEEVLLKGIALLHEQETASSPNPWLLDEAIAVLSMYSLVHRDSTTKMLSLHRVVQAVLQDTLATHEQEAWVRRVILALHQTFPTVEAQMWTQCERLVPHVLQCAQHTMSQTQGSEELASLFVKTGEYLTERAHYQEAEPLLNRAFHLQECLVGPEHPEVANTLHQLARLSYLQGEYEQAEPFYLKALHMRERTLGPEHPAVAQTLSGLAHLYRMYGKFQQAVPLVLRALDIQKQTLGPAHPDVALSWNSLATLYHEQNNYQKAEECNIQALSIREQTLGSEHPEVAYPLTNLAIAYTEQAKYEQANQLLERALHIREHTLGHEHPHTALTLYNLAENYYRQANYGQAEALYQEALLIWERTLGPNHRYLAYVLGSLALIHFHQGEYARAEAFFQHVLQIWEQSIGIELQHPVAANTLCDWAELRVVQGKYTEAVLLYRRALTINEHVWGAEHQKTVKTRTKYLILLQTIEGE